MKHFVTQELVPPGLFQRYGDQSIRYFDIRILEVLERIREWVDAPMTINNWSRQGNRQWSGIRTPDSPYYSLGSAHSWGLAFDAVGSWEPDDVRAAILSEQLMLPHPVRLELGVSWLHVDVMNISGNRVETFNAG